MYKEIRAYIKAQGHEADYLSAFTRAWKESGRLTSTRRAESMPSIDGIDLSSLESEDKDLDGDDGLIRGAELNVDDAEFLEPETNVDDDAVASDADLNEGD